MSQNHIWQKVPEKGSGDDWRTRWECSRCGSVITSRKEPDPDRETPLWENIGGSPGMTGKMGDCDQVIIHKIHES